MMPDSIWLVSQSYLPQAIAPDDAGGYHADYPRRQRTPAPPSGRHVAVVEVRGIVTSFSDRLGTTTREIADALDFAVESPSVETILLDIHSPGSAWAGIPELTGKLMAIRQRKPLVAVVNSQAGSGSYWLASCASRVYCTPSGMAGGIGVVAMHTDQSKLLDKEGVKPTLISAGKYKVEGHPFGPLDAGARDEMQRVVDEHYAVMVNGIARGRNVTPSVVRTAYGQGRMLTASRAYKAGLVDAVASLDDVLRELAGNVRDERNQRKSRAMLAKSRIRAAFGNN